MGLKFGEPPSNRNDKRAPRKWMAEAAELRSRPKEWAVLTTAHSPRIAATMSTNVKRAALRAFQPSDSFEAMSRGCDVWVRYVGEGGQ